MGSIRSKGRGDDGVVFCTATLRILDCNRTKHSRLSLKHEAKLHTIATKSTPLYERTHPVPLIEHSQPRPPGPDALNPAPTGDFPQGGSVRRRGRPHGQLHSVAVLGYQLFPAAGGYENGCIHGETRTQAGENGNQKGVVRRTHTHTHTHTKTAADAGYVEVPQKSRARTQKENKKKSARTAGSMTNSCLLAGASSGIPCAEDDIQADGASPIRTLSQSPACSATSKIVPGAADTCFTCD